MPLNWCTNFVNSGQTLHASTMESIKTYKIHQEQQTDGHCQKKSKEKAKNNGTKNSNNNVEFTTKKNSGNKRCKQKQNSPNYSTYKRIDNDAECPSHMGHLILGFNVIKISMVTISALTVRTLRLPMPIQTRGGTNVSPLDRINATKASIWLKCPIRGLLPTRDENLILKPNQTLTPFLHSKHVAMNHGEVIK